MVRKKKKKLVYQLLAFNTFDEQIFFSKAYYFLFCEHKITFLDYLVVLI